MSYTMGQMPVPPSSTVQLFTIPNLANVNVWTNSAIPIFLGTSNKVSPTSGVQCHTIPTPMFGYPHGSGATIWAASTSASTVIVNYSIISNQ